MLTSLRLFLTPPIFKDEEQTRIAGLLHVILISCIGIGLFYFVSQFLLNSTSSEGIGVIAAAWLFLVAVWIAIRRGHLRFSSLILSIGLWVMVTVAIALYDARGIYNPVLLFYNVLIVIAGLTLGGRAAFAMVVVTALMSVGIASLTAADNQKFVANLAAPTHWWVNANLTFLTIAILIWTANRGLRKALDQARSSERSLREHAQQLEHEIVERRKAESQLLTAQDELLAKTNSLTMINSVAELMHSSLDFRVVIERAFDIVVGYTHAPCATLHFIDPQNKQVTLLAARNFPRGLPRPKAPINSEGSLTYLAVAQKEIVSSEDLLNDDRLSATLKQALIDEDYKSGVAIPLILHDQVVGTIGLIFKHVFTLSPEEGAVLLSVGRTIAMAVGNSQYVSQIESEIEERRKAETALRSAEEKYRSIYENAVEGIFQVTPDGRFLSVNPAMARILGYDSPEQLISEVHDIGKQLYVDPDQQQVVVALLERDGSVHFESQNYHRDGSVITLAHNTRAVRDEQGNTLYFEGMVEDITERKRLQSREIELAVALERERVEILRQFLHSATHDLRTPLSIMNTSLHLLGKTMGDPERQTRYIEQIAEQTQRMHEMIENMFTLSRLDTGVAEYYFEPYAINQLVQEVYNKQKPLIARKQHTINLELMHDLPELSIDHAAITTALRHIFVNALNYTDDGGQICLRTYRQDGTVVIEVADNGMGISADDLPRIFERFYRADKARQVDTGTSGLGLTIAQKLVQAHGGGIEVESQPESGSTFRLVLPYNA